MVAGASGQAAATQWLISKGANLEAASHYGYTALHYAALLPRREIVELLLSAGAVPNQIDREGQSPLHLVLNTLPRQATRAREDNSCDPSGYGDEYCYDRDISHGYTGGAGQRAEQDVIVQRTVDALRRHGADVSLRDDRGRTAADILETKNRLDLRWWLDEHSDAPAAIPAGSGATSTDAVASNLGALVLSPRGGGSIAACLSGCFAGPWRSRSA